MEASAIELIPVSYVYTYFIMAINICQAMYACIYVRMAMYV